HRGRRPRPAPADPRRRLHHAHRRGHRVRGRGGRARGRRGGPPMTTRPVEAHIPLDSPAIPPPAERRANPLNDAWVIARRALLHMRRQPEALADVTIQPIMFVLLFAYVFG